MIGVALVVGTQLPRGGSGPSRPVHELRHGLFPAEGISVLYELMLPKLALCVSPGVHELFELAVGNLGPIDKEPSGRRGAGGRIGRRGRESPSIDRDHAGRDRSLLIQLEPNLVSLDRVGETSSSPETAVRLAVRNCMKEHTSFVSRFFHLPMVAASREAKFTDRCRAGMSPFSLRIPDFSLIDLGPIRFCFDEQDVTHLVPERSEDRVVGQDLFGLFGQIESGPILFLLNQLDHARNVFGPYSR